MNTAATATSSAFEAVDYDPFARGELALVVPTTEGQREIWLADQLSQEASLSFNLSVSLRFHGELDRAALGRALQDIVDRHDALRANVAPGGLELCIRQDMSLPLPFRDLSCLTAVDQENAISSRLRESVLTPFSLATDPLFRAELLCLGPREHLLLLTAHHVVCDGWSWWVLVRELGALYGHHRGFAGAPLSEPVSFGDYALREADSKLDGVPSADEAYWLSRFPGSAPVLELPTDRSRPAVRSFTSARVDHTLAQDLLTDLRRAGARHGASLFATLLAGLSGLLSRLAGQEDIVVGIPAAGQPVAGSDDLVGHCVNTLPLRFRVDTSAAFTDLVGIAQSTLLDALEHQQCTFGSLLAKLRIARDPARMPLVSVLFNLDQALDQQSTAFPGLSMDFDSNPRHFETFEMFINAVQVKGELRLECQYNTDLFTANTIQRWLRAYDTLLRAAVESDTMELAELPLVDAVGREELDALQPAPTPYDQTCRMHEYFEHQCDLAPHRLALIAGVNQSSYAELEAAANRIAQILRARGIRRGSLVGLSLDRGVDMVAALLGILKSGAGYVPLDPAYPTERLAYMTADAGLALLITTSAHAARFDLRGRPILLIDAHAAEISAAPTERLQDDEHAGTPEDPAYVIYTSGSTGRPKGVVVPHRSVSNFLASMQVCPGLSANDRLLAVTTLSFDIAVLELLLPLSVGAVVVVAEQETTVDGKALRSLLEASQATVMQGTPSSWRLLLEAGWNPSSGFKVLCGGEPMAPDLAAALVAKSGSVWNLYGPTETTVWSTCARIETNDVGPAADIHIGRPIANTSIWILDPHGELCPLGVPGEICIGGQGVTKGYLNRRELTEERFVPDGYTRSPLRGANSAGAALLYRTGDRGRWRPDGNLAHMGRLDNQVKVRGYRIELGEIEANLSSLAEIARAVVIVREDRPHDQRLVAYIVAAPGASVDESSLRSQLREILPVYMLPQHFVLLEAIPQLPNGKVNRNALPPPGTTHQVGAPISGTGGWALDPRSGYLEEVWSELLGVPAGPDDNFFELGGHSMLAVQMASRVERDTGFRIKLIRLGAETLAQVASSLPLPTDRPTDTPGMSGRIGSGLRRLFGIGAGTSHER